MDFSLIAGKGMTMLTREEVFLPKHMKFGYILQPLSRKGNWKCRICKLVLRKSEIMAHLEWTSHIILFQKHKELYKERFEQRAAEIEKLKNTPLNSFKDEELSKEPNEHRVAEIEKQKRAPRNAYQVIGEEKVFRPVTMKFSPMFSYLHINGIWKCKICKLPVPRNKIIEHIGTSSHEILLQKHKELYKEHFKLRAVEIEKLQNVSLMLDGLSEDYEHKGAEYSLEELVDNIKTSPLIGIEYILEIEIELQSPKKKFICTLCSANINKYQSNMQCDPVNHLLGYTHKMEYIMKHFKTAHEHFGTNKIKKIAEEHKPALDKLAWAIEKTFGRLKHKKVKNSEFKTNFKNVTRNARAGKHFSERPPNLTFEDIVVEELAKARSNKAENVVSSTQDDPYSRYEYEVELSRRSQKHFYEMYNDAEDSQNVEDFEDSRNSGDFKESKVFGGFEEESADENDDFNKRLLTFHELSKGIDDEMDEALMRYKANPVNHPLYYEEWNKFWKRRYAELQQRGEVVSTYDFKPEWKVFWDGRMLELHLEETELKKMELKKMLALVKEPSSAPSFPVLDSGREVVLIEDDMSSRKRTRMRSPMSKDGPSEYEYRKSGVPPSKLRRESPPHPRRSPLLRRNSQFSTEERYSPTACFDSPIIIEDSPSHPSDSSSDHSDSLPHYKTTANRGDPSRRRDAPPGPNNSSRPTDSSSSKIDSRRIVSPQRRRVSPLRRKASPLRRRDSPSRRGDSGSRRRDSPSRRKDSPPRRKDSPPRRKDSPPRRKDSSPRRKDSPPRRKDSPPRRKDSPPRRKDSPPRRKDSPPRRKDSPPRRKVSPLRRKVSPPRRRDSPSHRRDSPARSRESPSRRRESPPRRRDSPPRRRDSPPRRRDSPSRRRDSPPRRRDSPPQRRDSPARRRNSPSHRGEDSQDEHGGASREFRVNLVAVLRPLVCLEDRLGALVPRAIDLLSKAMDMEYIAPNSSGKLLEDKANCEFFEDVKEKLKGQNYSNTVDRVRQDVFSDVMKNIDCIADMVKERKGQNSPDDVLLVPGVGAVDKEKISVQIVNTLLAQGRQDITQEELDHMIEALAKKESSTPGTTFFIDKEGNRDQNLARSEEKRRMEFQKLKDSRLLVDSLLDPSRKDVIDIPSSTRSSTYDNFEYRGPGIPNLNNATSNYPGIPSYGTGSNSLLGTGVAPFQRSTGQSLLHSNGPLLSFPSLLTSPAAFTQPISTEIQKRPLLGGPPPFYHPMYAQSQEEPLLRFPPSLSQQISAGIQKEPLLRRPPSYSQQISAESQKEPILRFPPSLSKQISVESQKEPILRFPPSLRKQISSESQKEPLLRFPPSLSQQISAGSQKEPLLRCPPSLSQQICTESQKEPTLRYSPPSFNRHMSTESQKEPPLRYSPPSFNEHMSFRNDFEIMGGPRTLMMERNRDIGGNLLDYAIGRNDNREGFINTHSNRGEGMSTSFGISSRSGLLDPKDDSKNMSNFLGPGASRRRGDGSRRRTRFT